MSKNSPQQEPLGNVKAKIAKGESRRSRGSLVADSVYFVFLAVFFYVAYYLYQTTTPQFGGPAPYSTPPKEGHVFWAYLGLYEFESGFDCVSSANWAKDTVVFPIVGSVLYMLLLINGREFMQSRDGKVHRLILIGWNLFLSLFSVIGAWRMLPFVFGHFRAFGFQRGLRELACAESPPRCEMHGYVCFWLFLFCYSKMPEMVDTVLMVLNKKKVVFLHWFHHITVMWFCYISWSHLSPAGTMYAAMNYTVHATMYMWYAMAAAKCKPASFSIWVTVLQISQMLLGCAISFLVFQWNDDCDNHWSIRWYGILMYGAYLFLFLRFFFKKYCFSQPRAPIRHKSWDKGGGDTGFVEYEGTE